MRNDPRVNGLLEQAIALRNKERFAEAAEAFASIIREFPACAPAHGLWGGILLDQLQRPADAVQHFQEAVRLAPRSQLASLGLFHSLWASDRLDEALEEIKRFQVLTNWSCKDYLDIVNEIKKKWLDRRTPKKRAQ